MSRSKNARIDQMQDAQWHYNHCTIEEERNEIPAAWCHEHGFDVSECLPDPIEPDPYDNWQENNLI